jgi:hypothetical protein
MVIATDIGTEAMSNMLDRFENASHSQFRRANVVEGQLLDLINRGVIYNFNALVNPKTIDGEDVPFWGFGQGISTQVGGRIKGIKKNSGFALAEWDGLRIICESGLILGWIILFIREGYVWRFIPYIAEWKRKRFFLLLSLYPALLLSFFPISTWGNLTVANFAFMVCGMFLSVKRSVENSERLRKLLVDKKYYN